MDNANVTSSDTELDWALLLFKCYSFTYLDYTPKFFFFKPQSVPDVGNHLLRTGGIYCWSKRTSSEVFNHAILPLWTSFFPRIYKTSYWMDCSTWYLLPFLIMWLRYWILRVNTALYFLILWMSLTVVWHGLSTVFSASFNKATIKMRPMTYWSLVQYRTETHNNV